jgi:cytoskeletal protein RodZ
VVSLGDKLRTAREARSLTFDQVSRDTNIATRYLEALETENFSSFPGEPYVIGFLKNYGTYLDMDVQELLSLYRAFKIQEQPVPVEQLLKVPSKLPRILMTLAVILALLGAGGGIAYFLMTRSGQDTAAAPAGHTPTEYVMSGEPLERRFYSGDSVLVPIDSDQYKIELVNLGEVVTIRTPSRTVMLDLSQESNEDLNDDGVVDLHITVNELAKNNPDMGAQLRFEMSGAPASAAGLAAGASAEAGTGPAAADSAVPQNMTNAKELFPSSQSAYPFTLEVSFQGYCMFRWERDRRDRNEDYFSRGQPLTIQQAQNGVRLWASNAQAAKCVVIGGGRTVPVELGAAGEVVVADILWVRDEGGRYRLMLVRMETD